MLSFISTIDEFFTKLFSRLANDISFGTFGVLFAGIIIGILICGSVYGILLLKSIEEDENFKTDLHQNAEASFLKIKSEVNEIKNRLIENSEGLSTKEKFAILGESINQTLNAVASEYYPNSKYPLYELNIEELIMLIHYIATRIEEIFNKPLLKPFRKMSISQIFRFLDAKKKIQETKVVKAANKVHAGKISKVFFTIINYANPVYWFKKLITGTTVNFALRKISLIIIDMVAEETNKTYSKQLFENDANIYRQEIEENLKSLEEGEDNDE